MSRLKQKIVRGTLTFFLVAMSIDYAATPREVQIHELVHILDSVAILGSKQNGSRTVRFLGPTKSYGTECQYAERLCALLASEPSARPTVWLQRFSYFGEYWLIKAEVDGRELATPKEQIPMLRRARETKFRTLLFVVAVVFLSYLFPVLSKSRFG
jgi:hypothetical protein